MKSRIGVDVSCLVGNITGIGRYTYEILSRMHQDDNFEWFLFSNVQSDCYDLFPKNLKLIIPKWHKFIPRAVWGQTILPIYAFIYKVDLFWAPAHRLPLLLPRKIRTCVTIHDMVWKFYPETMRFFGRYLDQILMPRSISRADLILSVSFNTAYDICKLFPDVNFKVTTIHLGSGLVDSHAPTPLIFDNPNINAFFLFVGTLEPRKNLNRLLKAYALLDANLKKAAHFVIVGGHGWGNINLEGLISDLHIKDYVHILGYVSQNELESLYSHSLFLAIPSLYEGFGLPITEAMKYGTPILCSNVSSMPEIAGYAAILVNPFDINSIHSGLVKLIHNPIFREELGRIALVQSSLFSWDKASQMTLHALNRVALL